MDKTRKEYLGCPVQHARQFLAGKWQMGILWNLRDQTLRFSELKNLLSGISDKSLTEDLDFFVKKQIVEKHVQEFPVLKTEYTLTSNGMTLIPVIKNIVEWGYANLQDEKFTKDMASTPLSVIQDIESNSHNTAS